MHDPYECLLILCVHISELESYISDGSEWCRRDSGSGLLYVEFGVDVLVYNRRRRTMVIIRLSILTTVFRQ